MYHEAGIRSIKSLLELNASQISFLGKIMPNKIVNSIQRAANSMDLGLLLASSGVFKSGVGKRIFEDVLLNYPNFQDLMRQIPDRTD